MTMTVEALVGTSVYDLSDAVQLLFLAQSEWGMSPVTRLLESGPLQHGATDVGFKLQPRLFQAKIGLLAADNADHWARRDTLLAVFKPRTTPILWRVTRDDGAVRQIEAFYNGGLKFNYSDRDGFYQQEVVELIAPDPIWYEPETRAVVATASAGGGAFTVPVAVPTGVGASALALTAAIVYGGTWRDYPTIVVTGPVTDCKIENLTTGETLDFTGYTIAAGSSVTIDLRYGYKTVMGNTGTNLIDKLVDTSDLATWHLEADPDAPGGANDLQVTGTSASAATKVQISYQHRFVGI